MKRKTFPSVLTFVLTPSPSVCHWLITTNFSDCLDIFHMNFASLSVVLGVSWKPIAYKNLIVTKLHSGMWHSRPSLTSCNLLLWVLFFPHLHAEAPGPHIFSCFKAQNQSHVFLEAFLGVPNPPCSQHLTGFPSKKAPGASRHFSLLSSPHLVQ